MLQDVTNTGFSSRPVTNNAALEIDAINSSFSFNGAIGGTGSLSIAGGNTLTLGGAGGNTFTGATTISAGTVNLAKTAGYAIPGNLSIANSGTYVVVQNANQQFSSGTVVSFSGSSHLEVYGNSVTVGGISGAGIVENTESETGVANGTLVVDNAADCSYNGRLRNSNGGAGALALVKDGPGTLTLTGFYVGQYTGGLTVNDGTLNYSGAGNTALPNCEYTLNGGVLNIGSRSKTIKAFHLTGGSLSGTTGTLTSSGSGPYDLQAGTVAANLGGSVGLTKTTAGTVTFSKAPPNGSYSISDGVLDFGTLSKTMSSGSTLTISGGTLSGSGVLTGNTSYNIQGGTVNIVLGGGTSIGLSKSGAGTAILLADNTYGGATTVNGGVLQMGNGGGFGAVGAAGITINAAGAFEVNRSDNLTFSSRISGNGTLAKDGDGTLTMSGSNTFSGNLVVNGGLLSYGGNSTLPGGDFTINGGVLDVGGFSRTIGTLTVGGTLSGSGTLTATAAYQLQAGLVDISLGGSVGVNKTGPGTVSLLKNLPGGNYAISAGVLNLGGFSQSIGGLQISGGTLTGSGTLTSSSDYDVQGGMIDVVLAGSTVGIHKSGAATATLTRANSFGGSTTISGGARGRFRRDDTRRQLPDSRRRRAGDAGRRHLQPQSRQRRQQRLPDDRQRRRFFHRRHPLRGQHRRQCHPHHAHLGQQRRHAVGRHAEARLDHFQRCADLLEPDRPRRRRG